MKPNFESLNRAVGLGLGLVLPTTVSATSSAGSPATPIYPSRKQRDLELGSPAKSSAHTRALCATGNPR